MSSPTNGIPEKNSDQSRNKALSYRWVIWGVMVFAFMVSFFHRFSAAVVKDYVTAEFAMSATSLGAMASMYFYAYMIMQIPVGLLADSLGPRIIVSAGMFLAGSGSVIFGFAPSPAWLYLGRFLVGLGASTVFVSIMKVQTQWFRDGEFATISGITYPCRKLRGRTLPGASRLPYINNFLEGRFFCHRRSHPPHRSPMLAVHPQPAPGYRSAPLERA